MDGDAEGTELAAAGWSRSKQTLCPEVLSPHKQVQEHLAGNAEEDTKIHMTDRIYAVEMGMTDDVAAAAQGIAAGQNGNARNSVIFVYVAVCVYV